MKNARTLALVSLLSLVTAVDVGAAAPGAAGAPSLETSLKALETARASLAGAVKRIEKDPPSTADLDAAHAAVGALKEAIDAGADNEEKDLDYAKAALAARKELRTQREYVDQRRAKVYLFNHRRTIDAAFKSLSDRARPIEGKSPSAKDFADAQAAAKEVRKAIDEARPFAGQDKEFGSYLAEVDGKLARQEKAIDDRQTLLLSDTYRGLLEESRKALSSSMAALGKGASDAQFKGAEGTAAALTKRLEEGKNLEAKDKAYRADADRARSELAQAKKRMDELWSAQGLARLKAEIEPAHKDLVAASRVLNGKDPTSDQLAEAKTAALVVRKLLEKFQPEASRSQAFAQYVSGVKTTLVEVEVELQRRSLTADRAAVTAALKPVERRAPTDEQFKTADAALAALEKTLQGISEPDRAIAARVADAQTLLQTGRATVAKRRAEAGLETAQAAVTRSLRPLEKKAPTDEQFGEAKTALTVLEKTLETVRDNDAPEAIAEARALLRDAKATLGKRRAEVSLGSARGAVVQSLKPLEKREPTDEQFKEAGTALTILEKTLETVQKKDAPEAVAEAQAQLRDAKATVAKRRAEVTLGSARVAVLQSLRPLEKREPTDEQFKEASTAVSILEKTLATVQKKDAPEVVAEAQAVLREAKATLARRRAEVSLDSAKAAVVESLRPLEGQAPTDEQFKEATTALTILEKTLAGVNSKDAKAAFVDATVLLRSARATVNRRRVQVDVAQQRARVDKERERVAVAMELIQEPDIGEKQLQGATGAVQQLQKVLDEGTALTKQDKEYSWVDYELRKRIVEMNARIAKRKIELASSGGRTVLSEKIGAAKARLEAAKQPAATDADLDGASKSVDAVGQALQERAPLEEQDPHYAANAAKAREELEGLKSDLEFAKQARALRRKIVESLSAGTSTSASAASVREVRSQKAQYEKALSHFRTCEEAGSVIEKDRALAGIGVLVDGRLSTPKEAIGLCLQRSQATRKLLGQVEGLIAFEEGPRRAYEKAKELLDDSKKSEALDQFGECIATGRILQSNNPELTDRKFQVGGTSMTLAELVKLCTKHRDALTKR